MSVVALQCKRCGGSLPSPGPGSPFVTCSFCGTSHAVSAPAITLATEPSAPSDPELRGAGAERAWDEARATSSDPVVALRAAVAARSQQLKTDQDRERAARLAEVVARGFDATNRTQSIADRAAGLRIAEAAVKAVIELESARETQINLPFLMATPDGPVHLLVTVTRAKLVELDAMGVYVVQEAAAPTPAAALAPAAEPAPAKPGRKWWPFG